MEPATIWLSVAAIVLVGLVVFMLIKRDQKKDKSLEAVELRTASREYAANVRRAEQSLEKSEKLWNKSVSRAQKQVATAQELPTRALANYSGQVGRFALYGDSIETEQGRFKLDRSVHADVDTAGNLATKSRPTLTRMAAGGLLLGPVGILAGGLFKKSKTVENRELYLLIEGSDFATLVQAKPDHGSKLRQLAVEINNAARSVDDFHQRCRAALHEAETDLATRQADRSAIESASMALETIRADRSRLAKAESAMSNRALAIRPPDDDPLTA